ncbi:TerD family protein [Agitococcus lubricus]|uniref:Tellurite resistance protein TerA n=1 Tax=Agitococcus lubricus TaxID=1077255 RepID=A0A2T5J2K8_9GAMM|nr:TerD family protein [Agitococcus lubricus]PTQ90760.1 tellurite resistance protein TerA [Agitococcus lubricus]
MEISRGQRLPIASLLNSQTFELAVTTVGALVVDISCFGLDATQKLSDERYMTFFNQPKTPCGGVKMIPSTGKDGTTFAINLGLLPSTIDRLVITAAIDGTGTMNQLREGSYLRLLAQGEEKARFAFAGRDFAEEKALMLGELYRKQGEWRFCAIGQGFNGGLDALVTHFGGAVAAPVPVTAPPMPPATPVKVSLKKVVLEKSGDKISLTKLDAKGFGHIKVNLNWQRKVAKTGFWNTGQQNIDLDLGCMFETTHGAKGVVQALGNHFGSLQQPPFIYLAGDDRTGAVSEGENLCINGEYFDVFKRILIFAFIYEGVPNWAATDGVVTIQAENQPPVEVRLDTSDSKGMCAIAMIENKNGQLAITKLVEYFHGHPDMDKWFGFGFNWREGSK